MNSSISKTGYYVRSGLRYEARNLRYIQPLGPFSPCRLYHVFADAQGLSGLRSAKDENFSRYAARRLSMCQRFRRRRAYTSWQRRCTVVRHVLMSVASVADIEMVGPAFGSGARQSVFPFLGIHDISVLEITIRFITGMNFRKGQTQRPRGHA